jgi:N-methylhydantoinase A
MADLMRRVSIDRGRDPRRFVLFAYGGAGPLHIAYLARDLGIAKVYVPSFATVFSAMGMLTGGILHSAERSRIVNLPASAAQLVQLEETFGELESQVGDLFDREKVDLAGRSYERFLYMKYRLQPAPLAVPVQGRLDALGAAEHVVADFERLYRDLYGANAGFRGASLEIVKARVEGSANTVLPALTANSPSESSDPQSAFKGRRPVYFTELNEWLEVAVYDGDRLNAGMKIRGAAVIERMGDTIVLPSFADAAVDGFGNVVLAVQLHKWRAHDSY